jgi:type IV pilus assembly protein PilA
MIRVFHKRGQKGFTLIELMIVIAIIGILAAIAVPQFVVYRQKGYNASANQDLKNAYTTAQTYFIDHPAGTPTLDDLKAYGFHQTASVAVTPTISATAGTITTKHDSGPKTFTIDSSGVVTSTP